MWNWLNSRKSYTEFHTCNPIWFWVEAFYSFHILLQSILDYANTKFPINLTSFNSKHKTTASWHPVNAKRIFCVQNWFNSFGIDTLIGIICSKIPKCIVKSIFSAMTPKTYIQGEGGSYKEHITFKCLYSLINAS